MLGPILYLEGFEVVPLIVGIKPHYPCIIQKVYLEGREETEAMFQCCDSFHANGIIRSH